MKILVADDDRLILATIGQGLEREGYEVLRASNGREAVDLCREGNPDLAILDVRMPEMSGLEAAQELAKEPGTPFLFLSAHDDREEVNTAVEHGALGYLIKPMDVSQLIPSIEAALSRAGEMRELRDSEERLKGALVRQRNTAIAVGLVMERHGLDSEEAFERIRRQARNDRRKIGDLAEEVIRSAELLNRFGTDSTPRNERPKSRSPKNA